MNTQKELERAIKILRSVALDIREPKESNYMEFQAKKLEDVAERLEKIKDGKEPPIPEPAVGGGGTGGN